MLPFLGALAVALAATGCAIPLLRRAQVMDLPNARSSHREATPRGGGLGVLLGVTAAVVLSAPDRSAIVLLVAALAAAGLGLVDDLRGLSPVIRLVVQVAVSAAFSLWLLTEGTSSMGLGLLLVAFGTVWLVGYLNAFNFMDGINGISALSAVVAGGWFAWLGEDTSTPSLTVLGLALAGASIGFLPWNAPRARVFLGDVGSYGIGMLIGGLAALAVASGSSLWEAVAPLVIYLSDTAWALAKRVRRGDAWHQAHREHAYQRLVDAGWSHIGTAALVAAMALVSCVVATVLSGVAVVAGLGLVGLLYLAAPAAFNQNRQAVP